MGETLFDLGQHGGVPLVPFAVETGVGVLVAVLEIGALERIVDDIEEESILEDLEELVVAVADGALRVGLVTPEEFARNGSGILSESRQEIDAVEWIGGIGTGAGGGEQRGHPVHADGNLVGGFAARNVGGPGHDGWDAQT